MPKAKLSDECKDCGQYFMRLYRQGVGSDRRYRCQSCHEKAIREQTRERVRNWRRDKQTPRPDKSSKGGSRDEVYPKDTIKVISGQEVHGIGVAGVGVARGGEDVPPQSLADFFDGLEQRNKLLYRRLLHELRKSQAKSIVRPPDSNNGGQDE